MGSEELGDNYKILSKTLHIKRKHFV